MLLLGHISWLPHVHGHEIGVVAVVAAVTLMTLAVVKLSK